MVNIYLFELGYIWGVDLNRVAKLINSSKTIRAAVGDHVRGIGEPDLYMAYSFAKLFGLFPSLTNESIRVGVIAAPIEENLFVKSNAPDAILISLFQIDDMCEKSGRSKEEYITYILLTLVLWLRYKTNKPAAELSELFHKDIRGCIFDDYSRKPGITVGLRTCMIDPMCKGTLLVNGSVPERLVNDVELILQRIRKPTFLESFRAGLQNPLFSFVFGGLTIGSVINVLSSLVLGEFNAPSDYYVAGILLLLSVILVVGNYLWILRQQSP